MGELVAGKVFDTLLIEKSQPPNIKLFKNFRSNFNIIPQKNFSFPPYFDISSNMSKNVKRKTITLCYKSEDFFKFGL